MLHVPAERIRLLNDRPVSGDGKYVLYWMVAARRTSWNFALDRAVAWASQVKRPLVVLEPLRLQYEWASDRLHRFVIEGMQENARTLRRVSATYYPYVESAPGSGRGLLEALSRQASVVVTDDYPAFFLPRMLRAAGAKVPVRLEAVDSNGILPLSETTRVFTSAHQFRRLLHDRLPERLLEMPSERPFAGARLSRLEKLPVAVLRRWPPADLAALSDRSGLGSLPIDHGVAPVSVPGGTRQAAATLERFLERGLPRYAEYRNHPEEDATSGLSPYLHFGHLSAHEAIHAVLARRQWSPAAVNPQARGARRGWWGVDENAESFLDELITWRELGFNASAHQPAYDKYRSLPEWARATLAKHAGDPREHRYSLRQFEAAETHDPLWNAAQRQLRREGRIHGYLRMLWGKKILEWSANPKTALRIMLQLNNKYAVDGRDPNSYSGIFWVLGRYDRPWAPQRPIFGQVRYMSSANTARKFSVKNYIARYGRAEDEE